MSDVVLAVWVRVVVGVRGARDDVGEGVISAAIAVLVMAFLGVLMWQLFGDTLRHANTNVNSKLDQLK
jgi:hypothetical protein